MMVDVDDKLILESRQTGPLHVAALDDERGIVTLSDVVLHDHKVRTGQNVVSRRHSVAQHHVHLFVQCPQHPVKRETRTQSVSIRADVRGDHEMLALLYKLYNLTEHDLTVCSRS